VLVPTGKWECSNSCTYFKEPLSSRIATNASWLGSTFRTNKNVWTLSHDFPPPSTLEDYLSSPNLIGLVWNFIAPGSLSFIQWSVCLFCVIKMHANKVFLSFQSGLMYWPFVQVSFKPLRVWVWGYGLVVEPPAQQVWGPGFHLSTTKTKTHLSNHPTNQSASQPTS
jgi:hypothetical protein